MAAAPTKAAFITTLAIGKVEVGVAAFTAHSDPKKKLVEFDTAGPSGGVLKMRSVARAVPVEEAAERPSAPAERTDPFGEDLFAGAPPAASGDTPAAKVLSDTQVDGEYGTELVEEGTGVVVAREEIRRGVRLDGGEFVDCTEQIAEIDAATKLERMDVIGFIDSTAVPRARVRSAYWLGAADEKAPLALRLLFEGLKAKRRLALVKVTKRSRQSLAVVGWHEKALMLFELVWAEDFRAPPAKALVIQKASPSEAMVANMMELIESMSCGPAVIEELRDDAIELREKLYADALAGKVEKVVRAPAPEPEDDVMAQLEASLAAVA